MNERIRDAAVKAGIIAAEYNGFDSTNLTASQRMFAHLIVQECVAVSLQSSHRDDDMGAIIANDIKRHFGV